MEGVRLEYARWLNLDRLTRRSNGLPDSHAAFARAKSVGERTLRRWRTEDDEFAGLVEQERVRLLQGMPGGTLSRGPSLEQLPDADAGAEAAAADGVSDPDVIDYRRVKQAIRDRAMEGDRSSLELYMKHWGHEQAELERQERERGFSHLSDDELIGEVESLLVLLRG